jgi:hypothetical protein
MARHSQFVIRNDLDSSLTLNVEPEGAFFLLSKGEEVLVSDEFTAEPVTLKLSNADGGNPVLSIWPGDGDVKVEKDGVDVLELIQNTLGV